MPEILILVTILLQVNGKNMEYDKHQEVVAAIKNSGQEVDLLVVDPDCDLFFKSCKVTPTSEHLAGPLPIPQGGMLRFSSALKKKIFFIKTNVIRWYKV